MPVQVRAIGTVEPSSTVQIKSQVAGELLSVHFSEGRDVNKGDLLFRNRSAPLSRRAGAGGSRGSQGSRAIARRRKPIWRATPRNRKAPTPSLPLRAAAKEGVAPPDAGHPARAAADAAQQSTRADQAAIESARASLESDQAAVARAKLDLGYCEIRSPVSGRAGNLLVHAGNLIKVNDVALVVINQIAPIFVSFGVPEEQLAAIRRRSAASEAYGRGLHRCRARTARAAAF